MSSKLHTLRGAGLVAAAVAGLILWPSAAGAVDFGLRGGFYTNREETFLGLEILRRVPGSQWYFNPNVEWVFLDRGDLIAGSFDLHYDFATTGELQAWLGAGASILHSRPEGSGSESEAGLNLLGGLGFNPEGAIRPYFQAKIILADTSEAVLAIGIRFF